MDNFENIADTLVEKVADRVLNRVVDFIIYIEDQLYNYYNYAFAIEEESIEMVPIKLKKD